MNDSSARPELKTLRVVDAAPATLFVVALLLNAACIGAPATAEDGTESREDAITFGTIDTVHNNVGAAVIDLSGSANYSKYGIVPNCTGILIHPRVFLTAQHCVLAPEHYGITLDDIWVTFDAYALNPASWHEVAGRALEPGYLPNAWNMEDKHEIGMWILKEPVSGVPLAHLAGPGFLDGLKASGTLSAASSTFLHVGYGGTLDSNPPPMAFVPPDGYRRSASSRFDALTTYWLQTKQGTVETGNGGVCSGDSGGPSLWTQPDGSEVDVGVVSWADPTCIAMANNYRIDLQESVDFINSVIAGLD